MIKIILSKQINHNKFSYKKIKKNLICMKMIKIKFFSTILFHQIIIIRYSNCHNFLKVVMKILMI